MGFQVKSAKDPSFLPFPSSFGPNLILAAHEASSSPPPGHSAANPFITCGLGWSTPVVYFLIPPLGSYYNGPPVFNAHCTLND